jgi:hypothetical protein
MNNIVDCTDKYAVSLRKTYDDIIILNDKVKTLNPKNIRKNFDRYWNIVNSKAQETVNALEDVDESINNLEDSKELIVKIKDITDKVKLTMNSFRMGTLQGLSKQAVEENDIMPNENDEIAQNAMNQLETYNELEDLKQNNKIGGRKSRKRGKGRKGRRKSRSVRF